MTQLALVVILLGTGPFVVLAAIDLWRLWHEDWSADDRRPRPRLRLSLVLATCGTLGALGATLLWLASVAWVLGARQILGVLAGPAVLVGLPAGGVITIICAAYLRYVRGRWGWRR